VEVEVIGASPPKSQRLHSKNRYLRMDQPKQRVRNKGSVDLVCHLKRRIGIRLSLLPNEFLESLTLTWTVMKPGSGSLGLRLVQAGCFEIRGYLSATTVPAIEEQGAPGPSQVPTSVR